MPLPRGPAAPALVQTLRFLRDPYGFASDCARRFGDTFTVRLGGRPLVLFRHPDAVREIFTAPPSRLECGAGRWLFRPFVGGASLLTTSGAPHARARRLFAPPFHGDRLRAHAPMIREVAARAAARLAAGPPAGAEEVLRDVALEVILRAIFGLEDPRRIEEAARVLRAYVAAVTPAVLASPLLQRDLGPFTPGRRLRRAREAAEALLAGLLADRRGAPPTDGAGVLDALAGLHPRKVAGEGGRGEVLPSPAVDEVRDHLLTLLLTGHETASSALAWAIHWIHAAPGVRARLVAEVDALGAEGPYLDAVCKETLRIFPVVPGIDRLVAEPCEIGGTPLEPGTLVGVSFFLVHHREESFPEPARFRPERFLERKLSPWEFVPFGGGGRRCLGDALALLEMKIVLAELLSRLEIRLTGRAPVRPLRRNVTVAPSALEIAALPRRQRLAAI